MNVTLWKGYHGGHLSGLIASAWEREQLLVLCPPLLQDFSFLRTLPVEEMHVHGTWTEFERASLKTLAGLHEASFDGPIDSPFKPVLGVFTSGTMSASPRLVLYSKANLRAALEGIYSLFDSSRIEHVFCYPQAFHTFGLTLGYLSSVLYGWELHTPRGKYGRASHDERLAMKEENLLTLGTPTHFYDLLQIVRGGREIAPSYSAIVGGASVSRDLWRAIRTDLKIEAPSIGYGCTEAAPGISHLAPGVEPKRDNEIGMPLSSIASSLTPDGVEIHGSSLCRAIIQNGKIEFPEKIVVRDRIEGGESWTFNGRLDLTLNRGGQKFSLEAIEKVLQDNLRADVVAAAVRDTRLGEDLGLAVITPGSREKFLALAQDLLMREFSLKVTLDKIVFVDEFPVNECSKLDRKAAREQIEAAR